MGRLLAVFFIGLTCGVIALLPEFVMYFVYQLIAPTTELGRIAVLFGFWFAGGALCLGFAGFAILMFLYLVREI